MCIVNDGGLEAKDELPSHSSNDETAAEDGRDACLLIFDGTAETGGAAKSSVSRLLASFAHPIPSDRDDDGGGGRKDDANDEGADKDKDEDEEDGANEGSGESEPSTIACNALMARRGREATSRSS